MIAGPNSELGTLIPAATSLPCQHDPDAWFDRTSRTKALEGCLTCPARRRCAQEALRCGAAWGMWAGIWIDGGLADVARYLRAIADPAPTVAIPRVIVSTPQHATRAEPPAISAGDPKASAAEQIVARSSGHCEVMASGCRLSYDLIASRFGELTPPRCSSAGGYAVCRACQSMIAAISVPLARRLGYLLDPRRNASATPFFWRHSHWMVLDSAGGARLAVA